MALPQHLAEPGWPQFERDPEVPSIDYDQWTWNTPPWLKTPVNEQGFHVRYSTSSTFVNKPQYFLQRSAMPTYLYPPIAYWLDLVNYNPSPYDYALRLENIETREIIRAYPSDIFVPKMGEDLCEHCNNQNPTIKCYVAAWTPPNQETGNYPRLSPHGQAEEILHRGCIPCAVAGKKCSKMGSILYMKGATNKKKAVPLMDGKALEPLKLEDIYKVPEGWRILMDEPKKKKAPRSASTPKSTASSSGTSRASTTPSDTDASGILGRKNSASKKLRGKKRPSDIADVAISGHGDSESKKTRIQTLDVTYDEGSARSGEAGSEMGLDIELVSIVEPPIMETVDTPSPDTHKGSASESLPISTYARTSNIYRLLSVTPEPGPSTRSILPDSMPNPLAVSSPVTATYRRQDTSSSPGSTTASLSNIAISSADSAYTTALDRLRETYEARDAARVAEIAQLRKTIASQINGVDPSTPGQTPAGQENRRLFIENLQLKAMIEQLRADVGRWKKNAEDRGKRNEALIAGSFPMRISMPSDNSITDSALVPRKDVRTPSRSIDASRKSTSSSSGPSTWNVGAIEVIDLCSDDE